MKKDPVNFIKTDFKEFNNDESLYCEDWAIAYALQNGLKYGSPAIIAIIDVIVVAIFEGLGDF